MTGKLLARETCGSEIQQSYVKFENSDKLYVVKRWPRKWSSLRTFFSEIFLPVGYPDSVSSDYARYQIWDSIQAFASSITGTLATQSVLAGVGVGDQGASVLAATTTWILRDGTGMTGRILFAWFQGSNLDYDSKKWRLFADILNDIAIFLELMCQYFKGYVTAVLCVSSIAKSIVGVAGGATRAALTQHQARSNNMADVSAKDGSQETLVNLAAFLFSLLLLRIVAGNPWLLYSIFISFTLLHIFANYRAVSCVVMETFNRSRYAIVVRHFLEMAGDIAPVAWVNAHESVWIQCGKPFVSINLGVPLSSIAPTSKELQCRIQDAVGDQKAEPAYLLAVVRDSSRHYNINIVLSSESTVKDQMEAMFHAFLLEAILLKLRVGVDHPWAVDIADVENTAEDLSSDDHRLFRSSRAMVNKCFPLLWKALEGSEWQTDRALFGATEWRVTWCEDETVSPGDTSHSKQV
ncbi:hypothetical protein HPB49_006134 [Dermacentor silvarum]|uniref:Uncharacterized protein n=1 Tax=Dermacentor silvarum TaxID=543639 RepID=A0ACB8D375_DERSI|nr:RUS family member 1 isoform X1 [Dermacentor silvarum]KAH7958892.1 hypothetical protein HPB49_006134 [Dermacentor silvarum]